MSVGYFVDCNTSVDVSSDMDCFPLNYICNCYGPERERERDCDEIADLFYTVNDWSCFSSTDY